MEIRKQTLPVSAEFDLNPREGSWAAFGVFIGGKYGTEEVYLHQRPYGRRIEVPALEFRKRVAWYLKENSVIQDCKIETCVPPDEGFDYKIFYMPGKNWGVWKLKMLSERQAIEFFSKEGIQKGRVLSHQAKELYRQIKHRVGSKRRKPEVVWQLSKAINASSVRSKASPPQVK